MLSPSGRRACVGTNPPHGGDRRPCRWAASASPSTTTCSQSDPTDPHSVLNPANYPLVGDTAGPIAIRGSPTTAAGRTAVLTFDALAADHYSLQVGTGVQSTEGLDLAEAYASDFQAVADFTPLVTIRFANAPGHAAARPSPTT